MNVNDYEIVDLFKSPKENKKYRVVLKNKINGKIKNIDFGQIGYEQYKDSTPLKLYKNFDHLDEKRLKNFRSRFRNQYNPNIYSPLWFSWNCLW